MRSYRTSHAGYDAGVASLLTLLLHPDRRRPGPAVIQVDLRRVVLGGMLAWTVALIACGALYLLGDVGVTAVLTCAAGLALGGLGLLWVRRRGDAGPPA